MKIREAAAAALLAGDDATADRLRALLKPPAGPLRLVKGVGR